MNKLQCSAYLQSMTMRQKRQIKRALTGHDGGNALRDAWLPSEHHQGA